MPVFRPYSYFSSFLVLLELVMQLSKPLLEMEEKVGLSHLLPRGFQFSIFTLCVPAGTRGNYSKDPMGQGEVRRVNLQSMHKMFIGKV